MATVNEAFAMLTQTDEVTELRTRHRDFYLALAERADRELRGPEQAAWLELLDANQDNLRAALDWSLARGDDECLRLCGALLWYWTVRGQGPFSDETSKRLDDSLASADGRSEPAQRARVMAAAGVGAWSFQPGKAAPLLADAVALARASGDDRAICEALLASSGFLHGGQIFRTPERAHVQEAIEVARTSGDPILLADALYANVSRADALQLLLPDDARGSDTRSGERTSTLREVQEIYRHAGDARTAALVALDLGRGAVDEDAPSAEAHFLEAIGTAQVLRDPGMLGVAAVGLMRGASLCGDYSKTRGTVDDAVAVLAQWSTRHHSVTLADLGHLHAECGDYIAARAAFDVVIETLRGTGYHLNALIGLALVAQGEGNRAGALAFAREAAGMGPWKYMRCLSLATLADLAQAQGDLQTAREAIEEARALLPALRIHNGLATERVHRALAELARCEGNLDEANAMFETLAAELPWLYMRGAPDKRDLTGRVARLRGDFDRAQETHRHSLVELHRIGHRVRALFSIEQLAALAGARGQLDRAARLFGAADAARESMSYAVPMTERRDREHDIAFVRAGLTDFETIRDEGRAMSYEEAVALALQT